MANWYYYDASGKKTGPVDNEGMKRLAGNGVITPETVIETEAGRKGVAGKIQGLEFTPGKNSPASEVELEHVFLEDIKRIDNSNSHTTVLRESMEADVFIVDIIMSFFSSILFFASAAGVIYAFGAETFPILIPAFAGIVASVILFFTWKLAKSFLLLFSYMVSSVSFIASQSESS